MWAANSSMITAARSNTSSAKTWEPTWQWKPTQLHMGLAEGEEGDLLGLAGLDGAAEFGIHLAGGDGLVGVGVDAGGQAEQHPLLDTPPAASASMALISSTLSATK